MTQDAVSDQIKELEALRSQLRLWRMVIPLATVAIVTYGVFSIYQAAADLVVDGPPREEFVSAYTSGLNREVRPMVEKIAQQTFSATQKAVQKEIVRLNERTPEMAGALKKEVETLVHNIPRRGEKALQASFGVMVKKREAEIRKMYPDVTEQKIASLVLGLTELSQQGVDHITHQLFSPHLESLSHIMESVSHIQRTEAVAPQEDLASWDMALIVFDLIRDEFADLHVTEASVGSSAKHHKKSKPVAAKPAAQSNVKPAKQ